MSIASITSSALTKKPYTIQPDEIVFLSDWNIRIRSLAHHAFPMWVEVGGDLSYRVVVEGFENQASYLLCKKDCMLRIREEWLGVMRIVEGE